MGRDRRWVSKLAVSLSLSALPLVSGLALAATCVAVPPDVEVPAVTACEDATTYQFDVTGTTYAYEKTVFRQRLRDELGRWAAATGLTVPADAAVDFWIAVPDANPGATQGRAVLRSATLNLVWFLSLHPDTWVAASRDIGILPERGGGYPNSFGHRPSQLLVKARAGSDGAARESLLAEHGAREPQAFGGGWAVYTTAVAREAAVLQSVQTDPRSQPLVEHLGLNQLVEWIALRRLAFTFAFSER